MPERSTYSDGQLAQSCFRVYWSCVCPDELPWADVDPQMQRGWLHMAQQGRVALPEMENRTWHDVAELLFGLFLAGAGMTEEGLEYDAIVPGERIAWEAVARHLASLLYGEDEVSAEEQETHWPEWAQRRLRTQFSMS